VPTVGEPGGARIVVFVETPVKVSAGGATIFG
jgi:hypothetical protein